MTWLLWQQQRRQAFLVGAALVFAAIFLGATGVRVASTYHSALQACTSSAQGCGNLGNVVLWGGSRLSDVVIAVGFLIPFVLALFWGVPLAAREFEEGTQRLVWTQSVSRRRWLAVRLSWAIGSAAVVATIVSSLISWWYGPINSAQHNRLGSAVFDSQGLVPIGYAICGVALGAALGVLLRRTVPAMGLTFLIFGVLRYVTAEYLRPHWLTANTLLVNLTGSGSGFPRASWVLSQTIVNASKHPVPLLNGSPAPASIPLVCRAINSGKQLGACLDAHGYHYLVAYQPANRFWALQGMETAIFVGIAVLLVAFTFWWVARRDA